MMVHKEMRLIKQKESETTCEQKQTRKENVWTKTSAALSFQTSVVQTRQLMSPISSLQRRL